MIEDVEAPWWTKVGDALGTNECERRIRRLELRAWAAGDQATVDQCEAAMDALSGASDPIALGAFNACMAEVGHEPDAPWN